MNIESIESSDIENKIKSFIKENGTACGGDWSGMFMSAIQRGMPEVWAKMPDREYELVDLWNIIGNTLRGEEFNPDTFPFFNYLDC